MNYTMHQLLIFLKVAEFQSVTKAAESLHLTQPAVSVQLRKFQDQFEVPLFHYRSRKIFLTDFGHELARSAAEVIELIHGINYQAKAYGGALSGKLRMAIVSTGKYVMPYFLEPFLDRHPQVELRMDVTNKSGVMHALENSDAELALVSTLPRQMKIAQLPILENRLFFVSGQRKQLPAKTYHPEELQQLPLIYRELGSATRLVMEQVFGQKKASESKQMELTSNEAVKQAVLAGLGYSVMPLIGLRNEIKNGELQIIKVEGLPIVTEWRLIWLSTRALSPIAKKYLSFIEEEKQNIYKTHFAWTEDYK